MGNPLNANCQGFALDSNGKVVGVRLTYFPDASAQFELISCALIDERAAQGTTIATVEVLDKNNITTYVRCALCYPWDTWAVGAKFQNALLPGNAHVPYEHVITNGYNPPNRGPLAIAIINANGNVISDVIAGLGLPLNRHVGYHIVFRERGAGNDDGGGDDGQGDTGETTALLKETLAVLTKLARHFGVSV